MPADLSTIDAIQKVPQLVALFSSSDYEDIEPGDWLIATLTLGSDGGGSARGSVTSALLCTKVERGLLTHLRDLLLELGRGFAFMGSQVPLEVAGESFYLDLLFYHVRLKCFFVIELKSGPFKPEWAGKLNFYLSAVDDRMRTSGDAPTIGLLLCEGHRSAIVEYTLFANRRRQLASHAIAGDADRACRYCARVHTASLCCVQALFLEVMAEKEDQLCSTSGLPQCGQAGLSVSCSAMVSIFKKVCLQALQKNS